MCMERGLLMENKLYTSPITCLTYVNKPFHLWDMWNSALAAETLLVNKHFQSSEKDRLPIIESKWFVLEYSPLTCNWLFEFEAGNRVTPCNYMSLWCWLSSLICGVVSPLGHTIARQPQSHEETWISPCGKDGWFTLQWGNHRGKDCCQAIHNQTMG